MQNQFGNLYIVATPIGNLEDITFRAVRILSEVDYVFAEDTRTTGIIFNKYEINFNNSAGEKKLISYNSKNQERKNFEILEKLNQGFNLALVTDAGTPGVSDPGYSAVFFVRNYLQETFSDDPEAQNKIFSVPGPSALTAFLSAVGTGTHAFTFYGFLPHKNGRQKAIKKMIENENSSIFYESTHRILKCLQEINKIQKDKISEDNNFQERKVVVGKELTKIHENYFSGTASQILEFFTRNPQKTKGEFVVMVV
jgi:16S rRNA (cytidine1402-2'-O)-methyltransferase